MVIVIQKHTLYGQEKSQDRCFCRACMATECLRRKCVNVHECERKFAAS